MGTVVIIGGGVGGAAAARLLRRQLGPGHLVTLVEQEAVVLNQAAYPLLAVGRRNRQNLSRNINRLSRPGLQVIKDRVQRIDHLTRRVYTENREIRYDLLVVAAGAGLKAGQPHGVIETGYNAFTFKGAAGIFSRIKNFQGEEIAILAAPSPRTKYPAAPYEYALLLENWFKKQGRRKDLSISIFTPEPSPLHSFGPYVAEALAELLLKRNIRVHAATQVTRVDPDKKLVQPDYGSFPFDLLIYCPESAPPPVLRESGLADQSGWLPVNRHTLLAAQEGILGLGDAVRITDADGNALPQMGAVARAQARTAAANIARLFSGKQPDKVHTYKAAWFLDAGRETLLFSGDFYGAGAPFRPHPASALLNSFKSLWREHAWRRDH